jgi:3-deoxy-D-manno-octulosonate 8-phosphate phosphatase (KDO 8-P phosphatase)
VIDEEELHRKLARAEVLILDVDGVQTDGGLYYAEDGSELRRFHVRDGTGIQRVMEAGLRVVFMTHSTTAGITARAAKLGVSRCLSGVSDKLGAVTALCAEWQLEMSQIAFMGDDLNDLAVLTAVGCPLTVADGVPEVLDVAIWKSTKPGGSGAVREICDILAALRCLKT